MKIRILMIALLSAVIKLLAAQQPVLTVNSGHSLAVLSACFSPDGRYILSGSSDYAVKLWEVASGKEIRLFTGHSQIVLAVCFSPDGTHALSWSGDRIFKYWDILSGKETFSHSGKMKLEDPNGKNIISSDMSWAMSAKCYSPDGKYSLSGWSYGGTIPTYTNTLTLNDILTGNEIRSFTGHSGGINSTRFSPDSKYILTGSVDSTVRLWDVSTGMQIRSFAGHSNSVLSVCFSPDGKYALSGSKDNTVKLWDLLTGKEIRSFTGHKDAVSSVCFSPDGKFVLSGSWDSTVKLWDLETGKELRSFDGFSTPINSACYDRSGNSILSGSGDKRLRLWDLTTGKLIRLFTGHSRGVLSVCFSPDGQYGLSGSADQTLKFWNISIGEEVRTFRGHSGAVPSVCISPDGKTALSGSHDKTVKLWDLSSGSELSTFTDHRESVSTVSFSPDGKFALSGSYDMTLKLYDISARKEIQSIYGKSGAIKSANFSKDGKYALTGGWGMHLWDVASGTEVRSFGTDSSNILTVSFNHNAKSFVSGSQTNAIDMWDLETGKKIRSFLGHEGAVKSVVFSPDSRFLLSGSIDGSLKIWNIETGTLIVTIYPLKDSDDWVAVTSDGQFDGTKEGLKLLYYVKGMEIIPLESTFEQFYTPNLIARVLAGEKFNPMVVSNEEIKSPPEIKILSPSDGSYVRSNLITVDLQATDKGGGINEIRLYHNGKMVENMQRGFKAESQAGNTIKKSFTITLINGNNQLKATAFNDDRTESIPDQINIIYTGTSNKPNLYLMAVGINSYKNPKYNLNYAVQDAQSFSEAIKIGSKKISEQISQLLLIDEKATKEGIINAIEKIKSSAKEEDIFIFYYAGHGVMSVDKASGFYIIPWDATQLYGDNEILDRAAISAEELKQFSKEIRARKQFFVMDACQSGGIVEYLASRGAAEEKAIALLAMSTGTFWITATNTDQNASEVKDIGHGIFTYCILEGLKGDAVSSGTDNDVTVMELGSYLNRQIPEIAKKYRGVEQYPNIFGYGTDFPLVVVAK